MDYEVPDDVTVAFFDNPFVGRIFATVVDRLIASVDQAPRRLRIIYFNPVEHERVMGHRPPPPGQADQWAAPRSGVGVVERHARVRRGGRGVVSSRLTTARYRAR